MSWGLFKSILQPAMEGHVYGNDMDAFASSFTNAYDMAIKMGSNPINNVPLMHGNTDMMKTILSQLLMTTQLSNTTTLLDVIGPAVIAYWAGAQLALIPPVIPATGALMNITTTSAPVLNPGTWTAFPCPPSNTSKVFLDAFVLSAKLHLMTISGFYAVIAQYPPPAPAAPGIVPWNSYIVSD